MDRMGSGALVLVLTGLVAAAQDQGGDESAAPAEQYQALLQEVQKASGGGALSDLASIAEPDRCTCPQRQRAFAGFNGSPDAALFGCAPRAWGM